MKYFSNFVKIIIHNRIGWLTFLIIAIPNLFFYLNLSTSLTLGTLLEGCFILFFAWYTPNRLSKLIVSGFSPGVWALLIAFTIFIHFCIASLVGPTDVQRAVISFALLFLLILASYSLVSYLLRLSDKAINRAVKLVVLIMILIALAYLFEFRLTGYGWYKPMFPFSEPSHFAINFLPFFIYLSLFSSLKFKIIIILTVVALSIAIQNMTLLVGCLIVASISLNYRAILFLLFIISVFALQLDLTYFSDRASINVDTNNLSSLVYLQGWQLILESWQKTSGVGLGFQQLGFTSTDVPASIAIDAIIGRGLNLNDGGFLLAKFLSEFGLVGIVFSLIYIKLIVKSLIQLRKTESRTIVSNHATVISHCFIVSSILELFFRGSGYFTPSVLLTLTGIIYIYCQRTLLER